MGEQDAKCGDCRYWKPTKDGFGMCQCPSEGAYRGSTHGKGWMQTPQYKSCSTGDFLDDSCPQCGADLNIDYGYCRSCAEVVR